ncbi:MAG TPA: ATP-dependent 6-phosphofructokinase [Ktedonobacterales bacterium]
MSTVQRIAVLTSGGDAPGDCAAIRSVVRTACHLGLDVVGVEDGYSGLLDRRSRPLDRKAVAGINTLAGTMLGSAREPRMRLADGPARAAATLTEWRVDALVVIGGNGSQSGARLLDAFLPTIGVASTIDGDLNGADATIGFDTAVNTAMESIDRLKATATSHRRVMVVQVMGRDSGYLALQTAVAAGVERVIVPEVPDTIPAVVQDAHEQLVAGKRHYIVVLAEGARMDGERLIKELTAAGLDARFTNLGYVQRGGAPTAADRLLATRLGYDAVRRLVNGERGGVVMQQHGSTTISPFDIALAPSARVTEADLELIRAVG